MSEHQIEVDMNGHKVNARVVGCEHGVCGACTGYQGIKRAARRLAAENDRADRV